MSLLTRLTSNIGSRLGILLDPSTALAHWQVYSVGRRFSEASLLLSLQVKMPRELMDFWTG